MSETFNEVGIRADLIDVARSAGYDRPSAIQRASMPVIRRGGSVVIRGASGSGALSGALLALVDRLAPGNAAADAHDGDDDDAAGGDADAAERAADAGGVAALVISPTDARATRVAEAAAHCGAAVEIRSAAIGGGWNEAGAQIVAGTANALLRGVQRSALKLEGVRAVVIDGASQLLALGGAQDLEALLQVVPREAQRIVITAELTADVEHFVEAHARRALHVPARQADPDASPRVSQHPDGDLGYVVAAAGERVELLARLLGDHGDRRRAVVARTAAAADEVGAALRRRGYRIGDGDGAIQVGVAGSRPDADLVAGFGAPLDDADFGGTFLSGDVFVVGAAELAQLRTVAAAARLELKPLSPTRGPAPGLDAYRARVRRALEEEDIDAQLLVLEPLFDERSPAEVAAALSAVLRGRNERAAASAAAGTAEQSARGRITEQPATAPPAYVRLFISAGQKDNLRPADIVGAIAGEAGVPGGQVGRIEIRDTFTVVEVPADAADRVIRALNGTTMRGRSLRVDFDRKGSGGGPAGGGSAPPRPRRTRPG